jgi:hypothetical protein
MRVTILVGSDLPPGTPGSGFRVGAGCRPLAMNAAYPPIGYYHLTPEPFAGAVLAAVGPHPVYYERAISENERICWTTGDNEWSRDEYRLDYLAALLGQPRDQLSVANVTSYNLDWRGTEQYSKDVQRIVAEQKTRFDTLLEHLQQQNVLDASEAKELRPNFKFDVMDLRPDKSVVLTLPVFP